MAKNSATNAAPLGLLGLMAYIGAAIYFIDQSDGSFWGVILGALIIVSPQ